MLDTHYNNARTHINYKCSCGNVSKIIFDSFRRGHRCKQCSTEANAKKQALSFDYVKEYFIKNGCKLLEDKYINAKTKMKYKCSCGKISHINFNNFKAGKRCYKCAIQKRAGENHYEWICDRELVAERDKFRQKCYKMLNYTLKQSGQLKSDRTYNMLGYSGNELRSYITNHINWKNIKNGKWHLDHVFPIQAFVEYGIKDIKLINCLENLQPLGEKENQSKGDSYDKCKFEKWLRRKNIKW